MTATLSILGPEEVKRQRADILRSLGMSRAELDEREAAFKLDPDERSALRRLRVLEFIGR